MVFTKPTKKSVLTALLAILLVALITNFGIGLGSLYTAVVVMLLLTGMFFPLGTLLGSAAFVLATMVTTESVFGGIVQSVIYIVALLIIAAFLIEGAPEESTDDTKPGELGSGVQTYGTAGGGIGENTKFSSYNTGAGVVGERLTSQFVNRDMKAIGSRVHLFNSLKFVTNAMRSEADVDHAIVVGKSCFLIDSKKYRDGDYKLQDPGTIVGKDSTGKPLKYSNSMHVALKNYRSNLGHTGFKYRKAYIIVHTSVDPIKPSQRGDVFMGNWPAVREDMLAQINRYERKGAVSPARGLKLMQGLLK